MQSAGHLKAGSPPPMRGKEGALMLKAQFRRITPAYAGKRCHNYRRSYTCRDHPRLCGEKIEKLEAVEGFEGSPPPMRGKEVLLMLANIFQRITPAYAGKSIGRRIISKQTKDHPRLCGEKLFVCAFRFSLYGSPPPMRGKGKKS